MTAHGVAERRGGRHVRRRVVESDFDLVEAIEGGLHIEPVESVMRDGTFNAGEIYEIILPKRAFTHRKEKGQSLTAASRTVLLGPCGWPSVRKKPLVTWRRRRAGCANLTRHSLGKRPVEMLASDVGARMVEEVSGRIEHGLGA